MPNPARRTIALAALAAAIVAGAVALDLSSAAAQSEDEQTGRIVARRLDDGRTEFGWQPAGAERVLPSERYFPADADLDRWQSSSPVEVDGVEIGRIDARLNADGRIEFAFTPTGRERILTDARYFPAAPRPNRWLRSTEIAIGPPQPPGPFTAVSAGYDHTCGLRESGAIECWGRNDDGQTDAPAGRFSAISAGYWHTCAIRSDDAIECWGSNETEQWNGAERRFVGAYSGQTDAPTGSFSAVSAGYAHTCGLRETGAIECWGWNKRGRTYAPAPAGRFSAVSAGHDSTCAIRAGNGAIECWGTFWASRVGGSSPHDPPTVVNRRTMASNAFSAVAVNYDYICGLRTSGAIECWYEHQDDFPPILHPSGRYTAISASASVSGTGSHYCGLRTDATIKCWIMNHHGQRDAPPGRFTAVSAGKWHTCGLRESGAIECWGWNKYGQTDAPAQ